MLFLFLVDAREHITCLNPANAGVFVVFISGWKFSACASSFVGSVERRLHSAAAGRRPVLDHEICQRSQTWCCVSRVGGPLLFLFFLNARGYINCPDSANAGGLRDRGWTTLCRGHKSVKIPIHLTGSDDSVCTKVPKDLFSVT